MDKKNFKKYTKKWIIPLGVILFLTILAAYQIAYLGRIYPGVQVAQVPLGNKTQGEAHQILLMKVNKNSPPTLVIDGPNKTWEIDLTALSFSYQIEETVGHAYQIGRQKNPILSWQERKDAWIKGVNLPLLFQIDRTLLEAQIEEIAGTIYVPTINPQIKLSEDKKSLVIEEGIPGQEVNKTVLNQKIHTQLSQGEEKTIVLPLIQTTPQLTNEQVEKTRERAEKFLGKTLQFSFEEQIFTLTQQELINFLSFTNNFDEEKIKNYVGKLAQNLNRPPQNAAFQFLGEGQTSRVSVFKPSRDGAVINEEESVLKTLEALAQLEGGETEKAVVSLEAKLSSPQVKTEDVNNLGIRQLVGEGFSSFRGSISSRIHNIIVASSRINGVLIAPGESFSFNRTLGEVSRDTGYKEAYIIKDGRTVLGDGGGVCQVSTTLFRAILSAGLPIEERRAHAYRVSYYEQGFAPGLDATVWDPTADLKFKNDTPGYILIQTSVNTTQNTLSFKLYGTSDGRVSTIGKSRIWDQTPPPPDLYQDDPTLPAGVVKQIDWKAWGAKVAFDWKVTRGTEVLEERTFYSAYRPWQAVYLRGTGQ